MESPSPLRGGEPAFLLVPHQPTLRPATAQLRGVPSLAHEPAASPQTRRRLPEGSAPEPAAAEPPVAGSLRPACRRLPGVGAGLRNLGNSCYLNAALQCLTYTPPLADYLLSPRRCRSCPGQGGCIACALSAHVARALGHPGEVIRPAPALSGAFHTQRQEDAHEFLIFILDALQRARCTRPGPGSDHRSSADASPVRHIFGGSWRSRIKCLRCQAVSDTFDPYLDIALDIREARSVSQALEELVRAEELDGENAYLCGTCDGRGRASKALSLHTSPQALTLVLKRFSDCTGQKIAKDVSYPDRLDLRAYTSEPGGASLPYGLYAVLVHAGSNCHSGHYLCYVKTGGGRWHKMDDALVSECDLTAVLSQQAYVLFYLREGELRGGGGGGGEGSRGGVVFGGWQKAPGAQDAGVGVGPAGPEGGRSSPVVEPEETRWRRQGTAAQELTLDEWKRLQPERPAEPQFDLRKVESALPPDAVVIHGPKPGGQCQGDAWEARPSHKPRAGKGGRGSKKKHKNGDKRPLHMLLWSG